MRTIFFLWLLVFPAFPGFAIEVVVNGASYASLEEYKASRNAAPAKPSSPPVQRLPAKTVDLKTPISKSTAKRWQSISYEHSVKKVMADFAQNWDNPAPKFHISSEQLEERLKSLLDGRKQPALLVSEHDKLRVMELELDKRHAAIP